MRCRLACHALSAAFAIAAMAPPLHGQSAGGAGLPAADALQGLSAFAVRFSGRIPAEMDSVRVRSAIERELRRAGLRVASRMAHATNVDPAGGSGVVVVSVNVIPVRDAVETHGAAVAAELMLSRSVYIPETATLTSAAVWSSNALAVVSSPRVRAALEASVVELARRLAGDVARARGR